MAVTEEDELLARAQARLGSVLGGKYRVDRLVGVGAMAAVYAATHLRHANQVAVKVLHRVHAVDTRLRGRFLREGYAANSVGHPGTVRIHDDDTSEDGDVYLVMDLLEGETLEARWERKGYRLDAPEVAQLMYQLLDILGAAHAKGIVHRDIKPENLFFTHERVLKVLDFGVARLLDASITATSSGGILGTLAFMPPEQVLGKTREVDARSDLWSVAATAFTLLSGHYVHEAETPEEMMVFAGSRSARSLETVTSDVPFPLVQVFDRALMFDKADRWPDARAMQGALASAHRSAFGAEMPGHDPVDDEGAEDKTTVDHEEAEDKTTVMPEMTDDGAEPLFPLTVRAALPTRRSTIDGVVATTTDDIPTLAAPQTRANARPPMRLLVLAAIGVLAAIAGSLLIAKSRHQSTASSAVPVRSESLALSSTPASPKGEPSVAPSAVQAATIEPPTFAVDELPTTPPPMNVAAKQTAPPSAAPLPLPPASASAAPAPVATPQPTTNCKPPFAVDPKTGMKKWKIECL